MRTHGIIVNWYILKQWIALKGHYDWPVKLRISFAIHLRATRERFAPVNIVIIARTNQLKSSFCAVLSHSLSHILKQLFTSVSVASRELKHARV